VISSCDRVKKLPTAALSTSGIRVEVCLLPLSLLMQAPLFIFKLYNKFLKNAI
jgi:hypothetical protein